jgi:hypothetical protein
VIVAVPVVRVMEVPGDEIVDVISVGHFGVAARRVVDVTFRVARANVRRRARARVGRGHAHSTFVDVIAVRVVKVTVVNVVDVAVVSNGGMATARAVNVTVFGVAHVGWHGELLVQDR